MMSFFQQKKNMEEEMKKLDNQMELIKQLKEQTSRRNYN